MIAFNEIQAAAIDMATSDQAYTVNFVNDNEALGPKSLSASFVAGMEFGKCIQVQNGKLLDLKHGIIALFFVEFVRLLQGYDQFLEDFRADRPNISGFLNMCRHQQRRGHQDICFLEAFLSSDIWSSYIYELNRVQDWMQSEEDAPSISQECGLPVALFHELCRRAYRLQLANASLMQHTCCLTKIFGGTLRRN
jgi:hypothetical protein